MEASLEIGAERDRVGEELAQRLGARLQKAGSADRADAGRAVGIEGDVAHRAVLE